MLFPKYIFLFSYYYFKVYFSKYVYFLFFSTLFWRCSFQNGHFLFKMFVKFICLRPANDALHVNIKDISQFKILNEMQRRIVVSVSRSCLENPEEPKVHLIQGELNVPGYNILPPIPLNICIPLILILGRIFQANV